MILIEKIKTLFSLIPSVLEDFSSGLHYQENKKIISLEGIINEVCDG